jgi:hypothetical protein
LANGHLVVRKPRWPYAGLPDDVRRLLVTPKIDALLDGKPSHATLHLKGTDNLIADYCSGLRVVVAKRRPKTKRERKKWRPDFERLEGYDEIWVLCARKHRPGWRFVGRFMEAGTLVLLKAWVKEEISDGYTREAPLVIDAWRDLFGDQRPFSATEIDAYFKGNVKDVEDK